MPSAKKLLNISSIVVGGLLLIAGSSAYGIYYGSKLGELTERMVSPGDEGRVLEQLNDPSPHERELGRKALSEWLPGYRNSYQRAYDVVRGKSLIGMNGVEVLYRLGAPSRTKADKNFFRYKYYVKGDKHLRNELYITFKGTGKDEAKVVYTGLFICDY